VYTKTGDELWLTSAYLIVTVWGLTRSFTADIISTVEFDHTGNYLATGDKGGRVVLFERNETVWQSYYRVHAALNADIYRKKHANTSSTQSSNPTNPNLTI
jgi:hypothetical protein